MSFDEIFDLTAGVYFTFYNIYETHQPGSTINTTMKQEHFTSCRVSNLAVLCVSGYELLLGGSAHSMYVVRG